MATLSSLLVRKVGATEWTDISESGWQLTAMPMLEPTETKDPDSNDWLDEDGLDTYNAWEAHFKAFDVDCELVCVTSSPTDSHNRIKALLDLFVKNGMLNEIYSPWAGVGRTNVVYSKIANLKPHRNSATEYILQPTITLRVCDPTTEVEYIEPSTDEEESE